MTDFYPEIAQIWAAVLDGACVVDGRAESFRFTGVPTRDDDGGIYIALDERWDVRLNNAGTEALHRLDIVLHGRLNKHIMQWDVEKELLREAGRVLVPGSDADPSPAALLQRLHSYCRVAVVVIPFGGLYSSLPNPVDLGERACMGHLSREMETAIGALARRWGLNGFRFTDNSWWTEDFLGAEEDPYLAAELAEIEEAEESWQPLLIAVAVDQVGTLASVTGLECAEALLGAIILLIRDNGRKWSKIAPWILGTPTLAPSARVPKLGDDGSLSTQPLQVDSLPGRSFGSVSEIYEVSVVDEDLEAYSRASLVDFRRRGE